MIKTKEIKINVPNELRLGQLLYKVLAHNGYEQSAEIKTFSDGKFTLETYKGVDPFHIEDEELFKMIDEWIKDNIK